MTPEEFIIWLRGFAEAANEYNVTPKQWSIVKEKLDLVHLYEEGQSTIASIQEEDWYVNYTSGSWGINYYSNT